MKKIELIVVLMITVAMGGTSAWPAPDTTDSADGVQETSQQREERMKWWKDGRFGMFIHWGPVSLKGTEIGWSRNKQVPASEYDNLYKRFNPTLFNALEWVTIAKEAGMKYMVITTKHHDGFCLWDSKQTQYDIASTPFTRDILKELAGECRRQGIVFCAYYSIIDWYHPHYQPYDHGGPGFALPNDQKPDYEKYVTYMNAQLRELVQNYGPLGILWFDGGWDKTWNRQRSQNLYKYVRSLQNNIIVMNNIIIAKDTSDYKVSEQKVGEFQRDDPWETCMTICQQWAWKTNDTMKTLEDCIRKLVYCAGGDGNFLFNVGPMPDGRIEPRQVQRLKEIGSWLKQHGSSIYSTRGGPFQHGPWGASTYSDHRIYLHVMTWDGQDLVLPPIDKKIVKSWLLTGGNTRVKQTKTEIVITVDQADQRQLDTIVVLELDGPAREIDPVAVPAKRVKTP